jgi:hypothetical protein
VGHVIPSIQEAEAGGAQVPNQPGLHSKTLHQSLPSSTSSVVLPMSKQLYACGSLTGNVP